ncbi:transglutaminase domain-containing protein [Actinomadura barringtoniae]|uniref:Transglutaminase domain-containing protein n=2 Tax=Actinomadura barringtoniae TaxID=1427535 RepID=A0A939PLY7_9ACTN|nr:transglutaminase domain-containing protein [Actinomadura barringtoniae]
MTIIAGLATLASSVGLYPLFASGGWFWSGLGAVVAVAAAGVLMRRFRVPAVFSAIGGLAALHLYLTARFAADDALLGIIPTPGSLRKLGDLMGSGWDSANQYAAPVPLAPGILLLSSAGIGLVAVIVDLLAVRLRRAAPAGLPLLAMYSVPAAVREDSVSWLAFGVGALGYLALLMTDAREQVGGWGRVVFTRRWSEEAEARPERPDASGMAASGRRIGIAAVVTAVLLPTLIPGIHPRGMFGMGGDGSGGEGSQTVTTPDPLVSLKRELTETNDQVVLTYQTSDPHPDYLRMYALDKFDGDNWTYSPLQSSPDDSIKGRDLPPAPGLGATSTNTVTTKIKVKREFKKLTFLPAPYAPTRVSIKGDWRVHGPSLMVYSLHDSATGRTYTVQSTKAVPNQDQLATGGSYPSDVMATYVDLPKNISPKVEDLATSVTRGAPNAYEKAVRLQRWFTSTGGYTYDTNVQAPRHVNDLEDFVLTSRRGYCEQFAASMAVMARMLKIPARVAMGFTAGTQVGPRDWQVRNRDMHAWPELYFEGVGWVRFEPTPSGATGQGTAIPPVYSQPPASGEQPSDQPSSNPNSTPSSAASASSSPGSNPGHRPDERDQSVGTDAQHNGDNGTLAAWLAGSLLVLLLLAAPMTVRALTRRRRWTAPPSQTTTPEVSAAHAAWSEVHADALDHGLAWRPSDTPRAAARRLSQLLELDAEASHALTRIARAEELARYARETSVPHSNLRADVRTVHTAMAAAVGRTTRWRARLLPPSTMTGFRATTAQLMETANRLNAKASGFRLSERLRLQERLRLPRRK